MAERAACIDAFLEASGWRDAVRLPLAGDASQRRYLRLTRPGGSAVLMDAPDQDVRSFLHVAGFLRSAGFSAPEVHAVDEPAGLVLMEDFGDGLFARLAAEYPAREPALYEAAVEMLTALREVTPPAGLVLLDPPRLAWMTGPAFEWYGKGLGWPVTEEAQQALTAEIEAALSQLTAAPVFCLRDCHAENLIWLPGRWGTDAVGLLDFQDAVLAHPAYDLVSLLQDARRDLPEALVARMLAHYAARTGDDAAGLTAACAALGLQRNLRILGVFARLAMAFGKYRYVALIPRVWGHVQANLRHPALAGLRAQLEKALPEPSPEALRRLAAHVPA